MWKRGVPVRAVRSLSGGAVAGAGRVAPWLFLNLRQYPVPGPGWELPPGRDRLTDVAMGHFADLLILTPL
jgi:hypothetical protein